MATIAAFTSTIMEAAFGLLHNSGAGPIGARPAVVESIMVDVKVAIVVIKLYPNEAHPRSWQLFDTFTI